ncbi:MAG: TlpA disulfide reductase family protein [bacterium]
MRALLFIFFAVVCAYADADNDWAAIVAMDSGPSQKPASLEDARKLARAHFARHAALIERFIQENPHDPRAFDARLRIAAIRAATGKMEDKQSFVDEAMRLLQALEKDKSATLSQRAEAGFRRVSLLMQSLKGQEIERRRDLVAAARNYSILYAGDRRVPRLLVEVATICDSDPALKRQLLEEARQFSKEELLNRRIDDDLRRTALLDKTVPIKFPSIQGGTFDLDQCRGRIVILVFWSSESAPSLLWMGDFRRALFNLPADRMEVATVCLDGNPGQVSGVMKAAGIPDWPTACDGRGWVGPLVRRLGINALPTIFLFDQRGALRSINAKNNFEPWIRKLLAQPNEP